MFLYGVISLCIFVDVSFLVVNSIFDRPHLSTLPPFLLSVVKIQEIVCLIAWVCVLGLVHTNTAMWEYIANLYDLTWTWKHISKTQTNFFNKTNGSPDFLYGYSQNSELHYIIEFCMRSHSPFIVWMVFHSYVHVFPYHPLKEACISADSDVNGRLCEPNSTTNSCDLTWFCRIKMPTSLNQVVLRSTHGNSLLLSSYTFSCSRSDGRLLLEYHRGGQIFANQ